MTLDLGLLGAVALIEGSMAAVNVNVKESGPAHKMQPKGSTRGYQPTPDLYKGQRNLPCPCGSGKKFKTCHFGKKS